MTEARRHDAGERVDAVWKSESARIIAGLTRMVRDVGLAEELAQDALVAALRQWPETGVPDNPGAWLMTVAKRRAVDHIRRARRFDDAAADLADRPEAGPEVGPEVGPDAEPDDILRLMIISCHPVLPTEARVALTLRVIAGLTAAEIARAYLTTEPAIAGRLAAAKQRLAGAGVPFELPAGPELRDRLASVLEVIYLVFNEGYAASSGDDLMRPGLCLEALRLGRLLAGLAPGEAEVHGLVALMEIQASRSAARTGPGGEPVVLHEQDRGRWDPLLIRRGFTAMLRAREIGGTPGPYVLQAAIAVGHAQARTAAETDWAQIAALYAALEQVRPTPVVRLNRAVAVSMAGDPAGGLALVDELVTDPQMRDYHLLPGVRGDLLERVGRGAEARLEFARAAALAGNVAERDFLLRRAGPLAAEGTVGAAVRDFLRRDGVRAATARAYGQTLHRLARTAGESRPLADLTPAHVSLALATAWPRVAPQTWNRHLAAVRAFAAWAGRGELTAGLDRRPVPRPGPAAPSADRLAALWERTDLPLRERTLWRLLHESAAAVRAVLALDVEDLDLADRRARTGVTWRSGTALLLPELVGERRRGPLFLTGRRASRVPDAADLCPETGRRRLSYERAEYLCKQATGLTLSRLKPRP